MKTVDAAAGKWPAILTHFGFNAAALSGKHQPCPVNGDGEDRFRFSDRNGSGSYFCACSHDGRKGGIALLQCMTNRDFASIAREIDELIGNTNDTEKPDRTDPLPLLRNVQARARKAGDDVRRYLSGRGLILPACVMQVSGFEYWNDGRMAGKFPAMAVKIVDKVGKPQSWHMTYLKDGKKADIPVPRKVLPPVRGIAGCCARLFPQAPHIGIAEGIETAIAAHMLFGLPVWACISRGGLESFLPPAGVEEVTVFGDCDKSFAGQAGAYKAAENLNRAKLRVSVRLPEAIGDWNDVLKSTKDPK